MAEKAICRRRRVEKWNLSSEVTYTGGGILAGASGGGGP